MRHTSYRSEKLPEMLGRLAAEFLSEQSNRTSLITITGSKLSGDNKLITLLYTVLPDNQENAAQDFLDRQRKHFKEYVKAKSKIGRVPHISFKLDQGEKNRQKIDFLLRSD
jgi:ribosome-binding factor A